MNIIDSKLDLNSEDFKKNVDFMQTSMVALEKELTRIYQCGNEKAKKRQTDLGKLLVRERIDYLIDDNTDFFELSALAGFQLYDTALPAGGIITGIGQVAGIHCMIIANDASVKGGTYYPITIKKHLRAQEIAAANRLPCIYLVDSGGAFLPMQDEVFPDKEHFGRIFYNQANMSAQNIPQIAVVMGSCTAGGAYVPCMADISIMRDGATIFLGGPPLVKAATGEEVSAEDLGGADVHCRNSGVADYYAKDDKDALDITKRSVRNLNYCKQSYINHIETRAPLYPNTDLLGICSNNPRMPLDIKQIIARIVDGSEFDEFKELFAQTLICGFAHIFGNPIGIIANNGVMFSDSALKGTQFILLCNKRKIPLIFLQNITGFMVGKQFEAKGIAKHGAKMVNALACSTVPKITVIIGNSYGAGNYAMCGRAYSPDFLFMWPNARIGVMGGEQAANVLTQIKVAQARRRQEDYLEKDQEKYKRMIKAQYDERAHAFYSSARLWDDGVINPVDTRAILGFTVQRCIDFKPTAEGPYGVFRM